MFAAGVRDRLRAVHALASDSAGATSHAHDYVIAWTCAAPALDDRGFAVDIAALATVLRDVCAALEGRDLNTLPFFASRQPSVENIAVFLSRELMAGLGSAGDPVVRSELTIWESPDAWATYVDERAGSTRPRSEHA
jgi:6-pyruvoyltetrahydropterin/6-carboxytetrahydropterin synthase